jgi:ankyrin repeat protein
MYIRYFFFPLTQSLSNYFHVHEKVMEELIRMGAKVNSFDIRGRTPLHFAIAARNLKVGKSFSWFYSDVLTSSQGALMLLNSGADLTISDESDTTPLLLAVMEVSSRALHISTR